MLLQQQQLQGQSCRLGKLCIQQFKQVSNPFWWRGGAHDYCVVWIGEELHQQQYRWKWGFSAISLSIWTKGKTLKRPYWKWPPDFTAVSVLFSHSHGAIYEACRWSTPFLLTRAGAAGHWLELAAFQPLQYSAHTLSAHTAVCHLLPSFCHFLFTFLFSTKDLLCSDGSQVTFSKAIRTSHTKTED